MGQKAEDADENFAGYEVEVLRVTTVRVTHIQTTVHLASRMLQTSSSQNLAQRMDKVLIECMTIALSCAK
jgi:hypothetical protein